MGAITTTWFGTFISVFAHGYLKCFLMKMALIMTLLQTKETRREAADRFVFILSDIGIFTAIASVCLFQAFLHSMLFCYTLQLSYDICLQNSCSRYRQNGTKQHKTGYPTPYITRIWRRSIRWSPQLCEKYLPL